MLNHNFLNIKVVATTLDVLPLCSRATTGASRSGCLTPGVYRMAGAAALQDLNRFTLILIMFRVASWRKGCPIPSTLAFFPSSRTLEKHMEGGYGLMMVDFLEL